MCLTLSLSAIALLYAESPLAPHPIRVQSYVFVVYFEPKEIVMNPFIGPISKRKYLLLLKLWRRDAERVSVQVTLHEEMANLIHDGTLVP